MKRKRYKDMTLEEKTEYNYKAIYTRSKIVVFLFIVNLFLLMLNILIVILANLDKIISLEDLPLFYLH